MKRGKTYEWIPFYIDKWIFGSTRIELEPAERAVWIDLMALAAKDDGFVRANETTPYPSQQLAGMLCISVELLESSIEKCIKFGKLDRNEKGVLYLKNWGHYALTSRHKRRIMSENPDIDVPALGPYTETETKTKTDTETERKGEADFATLFDEFWKGYPKKVSKTVAREKFMILARAGKVPELIKATNGYMDFLKHQRVKKNFDQEPMHPATFLMKDRWRDYIDFTYQPEL